MFRKLKSKKGFTLTELIIVIAILGILAAVLVPSMMSVVGDANLSVANSSAATVYSTAQQAWTSIVAISGGSVPEGTYTYKDTNGVGVWSATATGGGAITTPYATFTDRIDTAIGTSIKDNDTFTVTVGSTTEGVKEATYTRGGQTGTYPQS